MEANTVYLTQHHQSEVCVLSHLLVVPLLAGNDCLLIPQRTRLKTSRVVNWDRARRIRQMQGSNLFDCGLLLCETGLTDGSKCSIPNLRLCGWLPGENIASGSSISPQQRI